MIKFNSDNIFVGYLKQLLNNFNLPKLRVYTKEQKEYAENRRNSIAELREKVKDLRLKYHTTSDNSLKKYYKTQENLAYSQLTKLLDTPEEKNVLGTVVLNDYTTYAKEIISGKPDITYPNKMTYIPYIKDDVIQYYIIDVDQANENIMSSGHWIERHGELGAAHDRTHGPKEDGLYSRRYYIYGQKILNLTKNLKIDNNLYDSYTHEYLGDYLRFQRDYNNLDLMSLYNCFSNRVCSQLDYSFYVGGGFKATFNTRDTNFKIYMLPVKLFKEYTIALECDSDVELCCGVYGAYQNTSERFVNLPRQTYKWFSNMNFNSPKLYSELLNLSDIDLVELAQNEPDLKLFIKIPANAKTSIVVLEGNYLNYNDEYLTCDENGKFVRGSNTSVINYELLNEEDPEVKLISPLQLLKLNTGTQMPFADRLIEYLVGNAVTHEDEISDDTSRVQYVLDKYISSINEAESHSQLKTFILDQTGLWTNKLNILLYDYIINHNNSSQINQDILGYCDKDVEKYVHYVNPNTKEPTSISKVDIYLDKDGKHTYE